MPAELSLYSLSFVDRIIIARSLGLAEAGLYSIAIKVSQSVNVLVRGFQLAFPPLAYSITDDDEARNAYSAVVTWFVVIMAGVVTAIWLTAPWIVRIFAAPEYFDAQEAVGPVAAGTALYALYMVLLVVLGRTGRTEFNFPATLAGVGANIGLNLLLVPIWGIVGAGVSLVISYAVVLVLMYVFTQRLFPVPYEWVRLLKVIGSAAVMIAIGLIFVPDDGIGAACGPPAADRRSSRRDDRHRLLQPGRMAVREADRAAARAWPPGFRLPAPRRPKPSRSRASPRSTRSSR